MKRRSKTIAQQCRYYEVDNIFEYMVSVYLNGNISAFGELYKELNRKDRKEFITYLFSGQSENSVVSNKPMHTVLLI